MKLSPVQRKLLQGVKKNGIWLAKNSELRTFNILVKKGLVYETSDLVYKTTLKGDELAR